MTSVQPHDRQPIPGVKDTIAISSGKGGVGKSTICANLALSLAHRGLRVGLADTDIYGPNIPEILGLEKKPEVDEESQRLLPPTRHGLKVISMGLLVDEGTPVIWRGPMLAKMVTQFLFNVEWGELDFLLLDLPPGTGDVQITLTQSAPLTGAVIITTPSPIALEDVRRGVQMFRQFEVPIVGMIENMSHFVCPNCDGVSNIFGRGGEQTARAFDVPLIGQIPLDEQMRRCADEGAPFVHQHPESSAALALNEIAGLIAERGHAS